MVAIPAQEQKRIVILCWLREVEYAEDREYLEKDLNMRLALHHQNLAAPSRCLVDGRLLTRSAS